MLAQAVLASYEKPESNGIHTRELSVTGISPCPYGTYLNAHHLDSEERDPVAILRMKNGKWQEMEVVEDLKHAGFKLRFTGRDQLTVHVGKVPVLGRPDGLITVGSREDILSVKSRSLDTYTLIKQKGLAAEPFTECQEQMYLASKEFRSIYSGTWIYVKHKDSCRPHDIFMEKNLNYSKPIIEATEEIILGKAEVSKPSNTIPLCSNCRHRAYCWKDIILDTSGIKTLTKPEVVQMWLEGQFHLDVGKQLNEEARVLIKEFLGDNEVLYLEDQTILVEARRIVSHRFEIDEKKFVDKYGADALADIMSERIVKQMRVMRKD